MEPVYPEELKEDTAAALTLSSLKHTKFDKKTLSTLHAMKSNFLNHRPSSLTSQPQVQDFPGSRAIIRQLTGQPRSLLQLKIDNYRPADIPPIAKLKGQIGRCSKPFEKQLTSSDVRSDQSRLTLNKAYVERSILPLLNREEGNLDDGIKVTIYDPEGNEYPMTLKMWASKVYVLMGGWKEFYQKQKLRENEDFVTTWFFYNVRTRKFCFAINWRRLPIFAPIKRKVIQNS
ncbi:hypothetical protein JCGZ_15047 [Jatropha curcas]|uniref:TF-B3 domain-containing protein n=1 Tax=Jatropha curcas TaxID=180498 RepID=A0A067L9U6_JATCU|nr:putative B3 domain-containing protein At4g03160 [Jatropha curcas]XP_037496068.1 putative B3 domain-containing protein At4g03160 [Jatropha curcas]KDP45182.1 hypothetical protein JCGZ_15047 [Jatropha curcas]